MKKSKIVLLILLILNLALIWGNSVLDGEHSYVLSDTIVHPIESAIEQSSGDTAPQASSTLVGELSNLIRKGAHIFEFLCLGLLFLLFVNPCAPGQYVFVLFGGMSAALTDETIQIFSHRTSCVRDIWIDLSGFVAGCLVALAVRCILRVVQAKKTVAEDKFHV